GEPGQLVGDGSLFRLILTDEPIQDYRGTHPAASRNQRMAEIHRNLLDEGVIISRDGLGCLSTPMGEDEVDFFVTALEKALR
ncbi:MAG TPA: aspartate aminotransferase family protein, partial [Chloroflexota bacterium]|nr:aspartate aminotransferase family protein [Chloroflexota bacterium]